MAAEELHSFPNIYPCSVGTGAHRAAALANWKLLSQIHGGWESTDVTKSHHWSGRMAQFHQQTSESWSPVRHSYWTKKAPYFKAVYCWNKINISCSAALVFLISTSLFFPTAVSSFHMLLVQRESLRLIIKNFRELHNSSQGKFKYRPYNPLAIATFIFWHNNLTKPGWKERFTNSILIKSRKDG